MDDAQNQMGTGTSKHKQVHQKSNWINRDQLINNQLRQNPLNQTQISIRQYSLQDISTTESSNQKMYQYANTATLIQMQEEHLQNDLKMFQNTKQQLQINGDKVTKFFLPRTKRNKWNNQEKKKEASQESKYIIYDIANQVHEVTNAADILTINLKLNIENMMNYIQKLDLKILQLNENFDQNIVKCENINQQFIKYIKNFRMYLQIQSAIAKNKK